MLKIPIEVSARHIHLSQKDLEILFGENYKLTPIKKLSQKGQYAADETVEIQTANTWGMPPAESFTFGKTYSKNEVRILGPIRPYTQLELSWTDFVYLGFKPKVALSGSQQKNSQELILIGPKGEVKLNQGIIVAKRHIHASILDIKKYNLKDRQKVSVRIKSERGLIFNEVIIRADPSFVWSMHIDTDEANAAGIQEYAKGEIIVNPINYAK